MNGKKISCFFLIFHLSFFSFSQENNFDTWSDFYHLNERKWQWGYFIGLNHFNFDLKQNKEVNTSQIIIENKGGVGFHGGLIGSYKLAKGLNIICSPGMYFIDREIIFKNKNHLKKDYFSYLPTFQKIKSTYLEFPFIFMFLGDFFYNMRAFFSIGGAYIVNLIASQNRRQKKNPSSTYMRTHNFNWQCEGGVQLYLAYFKIAFCIKSMFFIRNEFLKNIQKKDVTSIDLIDTLKSRALLFSLTFQ